MEDLEKLKKEYKQLGEKIKLIETKEKRVAKGDKYYFINTTLNVDYANEDNMNLDNERYNIGNYFCSEEEVQKFSNKMKTYAELKKIADELNGGKTIDWSDFSQDKYVLALNVKDSKPVIGTYVYSLTHPLTVCCIKEEFLEEALIRIGEERLIELFE